MTLRSFFSGLWRGLDALRKALHLILLLVIFGVLVGILRGSVRRAKLYYLRDLSGKAARIEEKI